MICFCIDMWMDMQKNTLKKVWSMEIIRRNVRRKRRKRHHTLSAWTVVITAHFGLCPSLIIHSYKTSQCSPQCSNIFWDTVYFLVCTRGGMVRFIPRFRHHGSVGYEFVTMEGKAKQTRFLYEWIRAHWRWHVNSDCVSNFLGPICMCI